MPLLKISQSIIRVAERILGLTGSGLPTEIEPRVQLGMEMRAIRPWEVFDEGLIPYQGFISSAAVVGQFSYARIECGALGVFNKLGDLLVVDRLFISTAAGTASVWIDMTTATGANNVTFPRDTRIANPPVQLNQISLASGAAAAKTGSQLMGNIATATELLVYIGLIPTIGGAVPPRPNFGIWGDTVNTVVAASFQGLYIPKDR